METRSIPCGDSRNSQNSPGLARANATGQHPVNTFSTAPADLRSAVAASRLHRSPRASPLQAVTELRHHDVAEPVLATAHGTLAQRSDERIRPQRVPDSASTRSTHAKREAVTWAFA